MSEICFVYIANLFPFDIVMAVKGGSHLGGKVSLGESFTHLHSRLKLSLLYG